jgi:hypothetical protein
LNALGFAKGLAPGDIPAVSRRTAQKMDRSSSILQGAAAAKVFAIIENEPASLVGRLLAIRSWSWSDEVLRMFPPVQQDRIRAAMNNRGPGSPALDRFLVKALATRLKAGGAASMERSNLKLIDRLTLLFSRMVESWSR